VGSPESGKEVEPVKVVHYCSLVLWRLSEAEDREFEASLGCIV
jgi:hypothetical protein